MKKVVGVASIVVPIQKFIETFGVNGISKEIEKLSETIDYFMICTNYAVGEEYYKELFIYSK